MINSKNGTYSEIVHTWQLKFFKKIIAENLKFHFFLDLLFILS